MYIHVLITTFVCIYISIYNDSIHFISNYIKHCTATKYNSNNIHMYICIIIRTVLHLHFVMSSLISKTHNNGHNSWSQSVPYYCTRLPTVPHAHIHVHVIYYDINMYLSFLCLCLFQFIL